MRRLIPIALLALSALGCSNKPVAVCNQAAACIPAEAEEIEVCIEDLESAAQLADARGCADEFDDLLDCLVDTQTCSAVLGEPNVEYDCANESAALDSCDQGGAR